MEQINKWWTNMEIIFIIIFVNIIYALGQKLYNIKIFLVMCQAIIAKYP